MESVVDAAAEEEPGPGRLRRLLGMARGLSGTVAQALYPPVCVACGAATEGDWSLCGPCWRQAGFLAGALVCDACGVPLPGRDDEAAHCDDCLRGRAPGAGAGPPCPIAAPAARWCWR